MKKDASFHDHVVHDLLGDMPGITSKAMFGGWALYREGFIFAIIVDGELYFKVDDSNRGEFEKMGSRAFVYAKHDGKPITMSYWLIHEEIMENRERLYDLIDMSVAVSRKEKERKLHKKRG